MATVASVDYPNKRIYLSADTVGVPLDTMDVYRDVRALRVATEAHRAFKPMIVGGGSIQKTPSTFTQPYVQLLYGCRIVPFDAAQSLVVVRDTFTDDGASGVGCFDRSTVSAEVDIDIQVSPVEVRQVFSGGGDPDSIADAVWAKAMLPGLTFSDAMKVMAAILYGKTTVTPTGPGTATVVFRDPLDTKNVVTAQMTGSVRTSVTLNP